MSSEAIGDLLISVLRRWKSISPVASGSITQEQYWILKTLSDAGPTSVSELARAIGCSASSASIAVKRLERAGMLVRTRSKEDERVVRVATSEKGRRTIEGWRRRQRDLVSSIFEKLEPEERDEFYALLSKAAGSGMPGAPTGMEG